MGKVRLKPNKFVLVFLIILIGGCLRNKSNNDFYKNILGLNINPKKQEYIYKEAGAPNEGFSFEKISYSIKGKNLFLGIDYPLKYVSNQNWNILKWTRTPFNNENNALDLLFKYDVKDSLLKSHIFEVKKLIEEKGNYIAFFYRNEDAFIYSIECYLLDITNKKIFIIKILT